MYPDLQKASDKMSRVRVCGDKRWGGVRVNAQVNRETYERKTKKGIIDQRARNR